MTALSDTSLEQLILANPDRATALDRLGLDFCCHGGRTLADACATAGIDLADAEAALADAPAADDSRAEWSTLPPAELARHIQSVHHDYLHAELPEVVALAAKVTGVHGERHTELAEVQRLVLALEADLTPHMAKEDRILFPAIAALVEGPTRFPFGSIANPVAVMTSEHETVGELLESLRAVTGGYRVPEDGCASYRLLYERLARLEADTHLHVLKENSVLFPAARQLEAAAAH